MTDILLYIAAALTGLWGGAHLFATRGVVAGFGELTADNRRIITMEWIVEGVALLSIAAFVAAATAIDPRAMVSGAVYAVAIAALVALALVSLFTGFKVAFLPFLAMSVHLRPLNGPDRSGRMVLMERTPAMRGAPDKRI